MEKTYYIEYVNAYQNRVIKTIGPMTKQRADRWFNNLDQMEVQPDEWYCIRMVSEEQVEFSVKEQIEMALRNEYIKSVDYETYVCRVWAKPNGYSRADSFGIYDAKEWLDEQTNALVKAAEMERSVCHSRVQRLIDRAKFTYWLYEIGCKQGTLKG